MTLATACTPRVVIIGNGTLGPYSLVDASSVAIRFVSTSHVKLTRYASATDDNNDGSLLVLNTDYTVGGTQDARTFTLIGSQAVLTSSQRIVAERVQSYTQDLDLTTGGAFNASSLESRFDKLAEFQQELKARLDRAPTLHFADPTTSPALPAVPASATQILGRTTAGGFEYLTAADLNVDVLLGTRQAAALAVAYPFFYLDAYGAAGNGSTDDTAAVTAAAAALSAAGGGTLLGRPGAVYKVNPANGATMATFTSLPYVGIVLNGAKLKRTSILTGGQVAAAFTFVTCENIYCPDILCEDLNAAYGATAPDRGMYWFTVSKTCRQSHFAGSIEGGLQGLAFTRGIADAYNLRAVGSHYVNLYCKKVAYSLSMQNGGDGVHGRLTSIQAYRDIIAYGHSDMNLDVLSQDQYSQTLLSSVNQAAVTGGAECIGWTLRYLRLADSGDVSAGGACVLLRFWGNNGAQQIRDCDIDVTCLEDGVTTAFSIIAQTDASADDASPPAHKIDGRVKVRFPNAPAAEVVTMFDDAKWAAVDAAGLSYDIHIGGNASATAVIGNYAFDTIGAEYAIAPILTREGTRPYSDYGAYSRTTFTPAWAYLGGSGFSFGNGTTTGDIQRVTEWDQNDEADFIISLRMVVGSSTNLGTGGALYFTLPSPFNALDWVNSEEISPCALNLAASMVAFVRRTSSSPRKFFIQYTNNYLNIEDTAPEAWDAGEGIIVPPFRIRLTR